MEKTKFSGKISLLSVSPHGDPEAAVLEDGTFVKIPPHSLLQPNLLLKGAGLEGEGELLEKKPHPIFHHVKLKVEGVLVSDDTVGPREQEKLKKKHKEFNETRKKSPGKKGEVTGLIAALGKKPKGEIDRILLADGTSIHVHKDVELNPEDFRIGSRVRASGEVKDFELGKFLKAETVSLE